MGSTGLAAGVASGVETLHISKVMRVDVPLFIGFDGVRAVVVVAGQAA